MGKAGHNAGFPLFSKPIGGKTTKHLRETTKHLVEITKDLGKTTRHLVFPGCYSAILQVRCRVTKKAIKPLLNIVYIKVLGRSKSYVPLPAKCLLPVYRLEEEAALCPEGAVRLSAWTLRACSYKAKAEA